MQKEITARRDKIAKIESKIEQLKAEQVSFEDVISKPF